MKDFLYLGSSGPDTFCAVDINFLNPGKDRLIATVIAEDRDGREVRSRNQIKDFC